jgi:hypothetical protein
MSEYQPIIAAAPQEDGTRLDEPAPEAGEPAPITDQEVGEYREQDRYLPVSIFLCFLLSGVITYYVSARWHLIRRCDWLVL